MERLCSETENLNTVKDLEHTARSVSSGWLDTLFPHAVGIFELVERT